MTPKSFIDAKIIWLHKSAKSIVFAGRAKFNANFLLIFLAFGGAITVSVGTTPAISALPPKAPAFQATSLSEESTAQQIEPSGQTDDGLGATPGLTADEISEGWISLFDGESFFGWKSGSNGQPDDTANWRIEAGQLVVDAGEKGLLRTTSQFDDFELKLEFNADERTNSGLFLRTSPRPKSVTGDCYELNIADPRDHDYPTGGLVGRQKSNGDQPAPNVWHELNVVARGARIKVAIDNELVVDYVDAKPLGRGFIGLQHNSGKISFRKIALRPLGLPSLLHDTGAGQGPDRDPNLKQWRTDQALASKFTLSPDGELKIVNGKGQIETKATFADFIFSTRCRTNAEGLNSGVFFRCIPGELMNGYESQIQNEFSQGNRAQPVDCGTGGIFRRVNARRVNANDQDWLSKTIVVTGPHISVWVNGYQVTDWTDTRKPDPNPRRGLRLEAGSIIFQGHDPTTDIDFKEIRCREIKPRRRVESRESRVESREARVLIP